MLVLFAFVVLTLASAGLTRLIVKDKISFPVRSWLANRLGPKHWLVYQIHCQFCTSFWTSLAFSAFGIWQTGVSWWWLVPAAFAMRFLVAPVLWKFEGD